MSYRCNPGVLIQQNMSITVYFIVLLLLYCVRLLNVAAAKGENNLMTLHFRRSSICHETEALS